MVLVFLRLLNYSCQKNPISSFSNIIKLSDVFEKYNNLFIIDILSVIIGLG